MLSEIKNEIKNILDSVNEVYNVYTEKKYAREPASFFELFKAENHQSKCEAPFFGTSRSPLCDDSRTMSYPGNEP